MTTLPSNHHETKRVTPDTCPYKKKGVCSHRLECSSCEFLQVINRIHLLKSENERLSLENDNLRSELAFYKKEHQILKKIKHDSSIKT